MSDILRRVQQLVSAGQVRISDHGYDEFTADGIMAEEAVDGVPDAIVVEDYPDAIRGPSVLVLQRGVDGRPLHILWGIAAETDGPAVVITAYRPDPARWSDDFLKRKQR